MTPDDCAAHFGMDAKRWKSICDYAAWFYQATALIRFDPTDRTAKAAQYRGAGDRIEAGSCPSDVQMPGVGTRILEPVRIDPRRIGADDRIPATRSRPAPFTTRSPDPIGD